MLCLVTAVSTWAQKIDFDFTGKTGNDRYTELGFSNWPAPKGAVADTIPLETRNYPKTVALPEGMQIICCTPEGNPATGIECKWNKSNVEGNTLSKLAGDAVCAVNYMDGERYDPDDFGTLRFIIKGLTPGAHTLMAYHNGVDKGDGQPAMVKAQVNGVDACDPVDVPLFDGSTKQSIEDISYTFVSFIAEEGKDVIIDYVAVPKEGEEYTNHRVYVCGLIFDAADPNLKVTNMQPQNGNIHVDAPGNSVTLSWTGSTSAASHRVMFGTSEDNLSEVQNSSAETYTATGLSNLNTYYWRIDEVPASGEPVLGELFTFRINHLAFPGAEGFGRYAIGGRGGQVIHVTSLEDDGTEGTLRWALETVTGPRTVVFDVSGIITLNKAINVNEPYVTIAGQTAPGDGIMLRGHSLIAHNESITRFIRLRMGSVINNDKGQGYTGMGLSGKNNAIVDHMTVGWVTAESLRAAGNFTNNITIQNSIIAEALTNGMPGEEGFGFGLEAGGEHGSFHHNLLAHNFYANPSINGGVENGTLNWIGEAEIYNNVAYNWGKSAASGAAVKVNFAGNYYKAGPASTSTSNALNINVPKTGTGTIDFYVNGNILEVNGATIDNPYDVSVLKDEDGNPLENAYVPNVSTDTKVIDNGAIYEDARSAYANVLCQAGASLKRDATDKRIINEVLTGTTSKGENGMIIDIDMMEYADYDVYENVTRDADFDANQNGIADWFESVTGKSDANADADGDGYTDLEEYLNFIAAPYVTKTAGKTAEFNLADYFAGINGATYITDKGSVEGNTLKVPVSTSDAILTIVMVTAQSGDIKATREFHICVSGGSASGINNLSTAKAMVESYELYNAAGMLVGQGKGNGAAVDRLPLKGEKNGLYILKIKDTDGNNRSFSIVIK